MSDIGSVEDLVVDSASRSSARRVATPVRNTVDQLCASNKGPATDAKGLWSWRALAPDWKTLLQPHENGAYTRVMMTSGTHQAGAQKCLKSQLRAICGNGLLNLRARIRLAPGKACRRDNPFLSAGLIQARDAFKALL